MFKRVKSNGFIKKLNKTKQNGKVHKKFFSNVDNHPKFFFLLQK